MECNICGKAFESDKARSVHRTIQHGSKYQDESWLRNQYIDKRLSCSEIASKTDVSSETIRRWLDKNGIAIRTDGIENSERRWKNQDVIRELYVEKELPASEIAAQLGCDQRTVNRWVKKHGFETRPANHIQSKPDIKIGPEYSGYIKIRDGYDGSAVALHRLVAVSKYGIDAVKENVVHHKNGVEFDNRPCNLELMSRGEHTKTHHELGDIPGFTEENRQNEFPEENRAYQINKEQ